ncbi:MAG: ATP-dependent helicase [Paenibacillaceae bacterium]|nr:ATP-dependent helicase [Paenibacillaceae bacterium]
MSAIIAVPVRELAEYAHRSGSIEAGFRSAAPLAEGVRIHKAVQEGYQEPDQKEVPLAGELVHQELLFRVEGRCDGLRFEDNQVVIEEIKSTSGSLSLLDGGHEVHWSQALCYAYLYAKRESLTQMRIRLLYVQAQTGEQRSLVRDEDMGMLERHMSRLLESYAPYARLQYAHREARVQSARELAFPFGQYRAGQRHLAGAVYKSVAEGRKLFARAPTGTGKTVSTLFPAVKAVGEGHLEKLFYVTARTTTRAACEEALALMERKGLVLRSVTLTAKEKICFLDEVRCGKETCPYADGYYDRINETLLDLLGHETAVTRKTVERYARKHHVCPFELSLDAAYAADAVIGDYNYVFDPRISLKRLWEEDKKKTAVLVDEAHNLPDRAREMYSAELFKQPFLQLQRACKGHNKELSAAAKGVNAFFIALRKSLPAHRMLVLPGLPPELLPLLAEFAALAEEELASGRSAGPGSPVAEDPAVLQQLLPDTYFAVQTFIRIAGYYDERYTVYCVEDHTGIRLKLFCLDPSVLLRKMGKGYRSHIFFSATLSPLRFYRELLGGDDEDYSVSIPSPFRKEQLSVKLSPLSVRYRDREASAGPVATLLHSLTGERRGNALVFFSSYEYMKDVYERFVDRETDYKILVQHTGMDELQRDGFLAEFQAGLERPVLGFAVLGGIFSEGIDLTGERLTTVAVVGVGLPQVGLERNLIRDYYNATDRNGFDYAYVYPGINKVLQAGGRLIRTEQDSGTLLLVDDRFGSAAYQQLLPDEWKPLQLFPDGSGTALNRWRRLYEPVSSEE